MELSTEALCSQAGLLLDAVARGETVTITDRGRPIGELAVEPYSP